MLEYMSREVVLARKFDIDLDKLAASDRESNGVLLYRRAGDHLLVECVHMTGIGTEGHVSADPRRLAVGTEFLRRHSGYGYIKFHTHCVETIRRHDLYFATHFSNADIESYNVSLEDYPEFIGMVVTPLTKLLYAPDEPTLRVDDGFPSTTERIERELM